MVSTKKLFPYRSGKLSEKDLKRINKMRNLVRQSAEENHAKFLKE